MKNRETFKVLLIGIGGGIVLSGFGFFLYHRFAPSKKQPIPMHSPMVNPAETMPSSKKQVMPVDVVFGLKVRQFVNDTLPAGEKLMPADYDGYFRKIAEWHEHSKVYAETKLYVTDLYCLKKRVL